MPDGALDAVAARYDVGAIGRVEPLEGGLSNDVFRLTTERGALLLRIAEPPLDADGLAWEHRVVGALARRLPEVLAPLGTRDGSTFFVLAGRTLSLVPYAHGETADGRNREHARLAARALGRLHAEGSALDPPPRPRHARLADLPFPEVGAYPPELGDLVGTLPELRTWAVDLVARVRDSRPTLATGLVHGDFFPGNVLLDRGRVSAILDWEEAHVDWQVWDVACAMWEFGKDEQGTRLDAAAAAEFVREYRHAGGTVAPAEDDLLVPLVRVKRILEVLRAPSDRRVDWTYQRENLLAAEALA